MKALKNFGLGLLWVFLIPIIAALVILVGAFGVINFFIQFIIMVINFFRGKKLFPMFDEDEEAYEILQHAIDMKKGEATATNGPAPQQIFVQQNYYTNPQVPNPNLPPAQQNPFIQANMQNPYGNPMANLPNQAYPNLPNQNPNLIQGQATPINEASPKMPELAELPQYIPDQEDKK